MTAQAILRLIPSPGHLESGQIVLYRDGEPTDLVGLDPEGEAMRRVQGREIAMVSQEPAASLSPAQTVGTQLCEALTLHRSVGRSDAKTLAAELLDQVGMQDPRARLSDYPHQLSGGMSQRVALALALCGHPRVLIADEPTTALDVILQAEIVELIRQLQADIGMAVLYITHDLRLVREACDEVAVMYLGQIVEHAPVSEIFRRPLHPHTVRLLESAPRLGAHRPRLETIPGAAPIPVGLAEECRFVARCAEAMPETCHAAVPALVELEPKHWVRCYLHSAQQRLSA